MLDPVPFSPFTDDLQGQLELASDYHRGLTEWPEDWEEEAWLIMDMLVRFERRWGIRVSLAYMTNDMLARCSL